MERCQESDARGFTACIVALCMKDRLETPIGALATPNQICSKRRRATADVSLTKEGKDRLPIDVVGYKHEFHSHAF